ncbi:aminopeptidase N [Inhella gelatinilytica]|uniref:Aminopeptidase N n=1 Tax=Inhella gelatinilytica TaxID=2795030 RepID=A0A931IVF5_9BURK|nr:aminopeptidase N [Inhella gelatinilytica]MBH9552672.1 aminopeptidase N [Inhella gelatinilytica]
MREGTAPVIHRLDYQAPTYWIATVDLTLDLDPAKTLITSKMAVKRNATQAHGALVLHGEELTPLRVMIDGEPVSFRQDGNLLHIDAPDRDFELVIRNTCCPEKNTALSGLYTSGGGFFTQCEAEGFRRITYFLDRPDVMAVYTVLLRADKAKYPILLSNGNLVEQGDLDGGKHFAKWHDPFPKPSYLFAVVAADLVAREQRVVTRSGKEHLLQVYVRRGDLDKTEHAMNSLIASMIWDEARFKLPLDLERFMIVGVSDFNMGAMENKGLNIFNTSALLCSPATQTDADFQRVEAIVAHEYFHNWTGNRVTCRDWFQLSLKEGLTVFRDREFSMDMAGSPSARAVQRIQQVRNLRTMQFPEDAGTMAHSVRPDSYTEINNFYTATVYEKGAEVVGLYQTLLGREGFAQGMALYFERHDGQAVTCDDFAQAMADANPDSALASRLDAFKRWYSQPGTPQVTARGHYDAAAQTYTLTLTQRNPKAGEGAAPQLIPVRMGLVGAEGHALPLNLAGQASVGALETVLLLEQAEQSFTFTEVSSQPVPSLLRGFSAPVLLDDGLTDAERLTLLRHDADAFNRWEASQRLALRRLLDAVQSGQALELDIGFLDAMRAVLRDPQLDPAFKAEALRLPEAAYIAEQLPVVDPQAIHNAVEAAWDQLALALRDDWAWAFEAHQVEGGYRPTAEDAGRRALANLALALLVRGSAMLADPVWPGKAYQQVKDATNMTERFGALSALVQAHAGLADAALTHFHEQFAHDALVVDKWFMLQARTAERDGKVFERVKKLLQHPDFTLKNPNRARSLLVQFCNLNPGAFHRTDAGGYVLWADQVAALDAINPQVAARLARAMDRWSTLAEPFRSAAQEALKRLSERPTLSNDVREIVTKALEA